MLKKSTSFVLAALGGSTYPNRVPPFASSLAAAALDGLFEHPAGCSDTVPDLLRVLCCPCAKRVVHQPVRESKSLPWLRVSQEGV